MKNPKITLAVYERGYIRDMEKDIIIGGIDRRHEAVANSDGSMHTLRDCRHISGSVRPALPLESTGTNLSSDEQLLYIHKYGGYEHYIVKKESEVYAIYGNIQQTLIFGDDADMITGACSMGHVLIFLGYSQDSFVWRDASYTKFSQHSKPLILFGTIPHMFGAPAETLTISGRLDLPDTQPDGDYVFTSNKDTTAILADTFKSLYNKIRLSAYENNCFIDPVFIRYGLRMYDGNYLWVSPPVLIPYNPTGQYQTSFRSVLATNNLQADGSVVIVDVLDGYNITRRIIVDDALREIDAEVCPYIDIFISRPIDRYSMERIDTATVVAPTVNWGDDGLYRIEWFLETDTPRPEENITYYRVESISVSKLLDEVGSASTGTALMGKLEIGDKMEYLPQLPVLEISNTPHDVFSDRAMVYNNRLHLYDIYEAYFGGLSASYFSLCIPDEGSNGIDTVSGGISIVYIDVDNTTYIARESYGEQRVGSDNNPLLSYPDARATRMILAYQSGESYFKIDCMLTPHDFEDMAYYYAKDGIVFARITKEEYDALHRTLGTFPHRRENVLKVSALNNPLVFPNDKTYTIGSGMIVSMAVATKAMSQGQFGQYPLYVFTDEGIYAMMSGGGDVVYSHVSPVNRHVIENYRSVCGIDEAVVYGTRQGLFVLAGGESVNISEPLDERGIIDASGLNDSIVEVTGIPSLGVKSTLRQLISRGSVAYNYASHEILLYDGGDVYAYDLHAKLWQSYSWNLRHAVMSYPDLLLVLNDGTVCKPADEDNTDDALGTMILATCPMTFGSLFGYKKIVRMYIQSHISGNGVNTLLKVGVAVSNDGKSWSVAWKGRYEKITALHNIVLPHIAGSYKYFSLIVAVDGMSKESYIERIYVSYDVKRVER